MRRLALTLLIGGCARSPRATTPAAPLEAPPPAAGAAAPPPVEQPKPEPAPPPPPPPPLAQGSAANLPGQPETDRRADASPITIGSAASIALAFAPPIVSKGGDAKAIAAALASNEGVLLECGTALHESSTTLTLKFRIATTGKVVRATASGDKQLDDCIARRLETLSFPGAKVAVDVIEKVAVTPPASGSGFDDDHVYDLHGRLPRSISLGQPLTTGDIDKTMIRDEVRRVMPKIAACYEQDPGAASGPLDVRFRIGPDGKVTSASATGLAQPVADCIAHVIQQIAFPRPKGGGAIEVSYPFNFQRTD